MIELSTIRAQLATDREASASFLMFALAGGDAKAVQTWQEVLSSAEAALGAVDAYIKVIKAIK